MKYFSNIIGKLQANFLAKNLEREYLVKEIKPSDALAGDMLKKIYQLRYKVYCQEYHYLDSNKYPDGLETDEFDNSAIHFIAEVVSLKEIAGTVRLVKEVSGKIPMDKDFNKSSTSNSNDTKGRYELSRLAVYTKYRSLSKKNHGVLLLLLRAVYRYCKENKIETIYAAIDNRVFKMLKKIGFTFDIVGEPKFYMGSESVPVRINLSHENEWLRIVNPTIWVFLNSNHK